MLRSTEGYLKRMFVRWHHKTLSMLAVILFLCPISSEESAARNQIQPFESQIERLRQKLHIPGLSVAVLTDQRVVFARGFGYADVENSIPATADTPYHIASLSKPFAAAVLMKLVEAGRLDLDERMADILDDAVFHYSGAVIAGYAAACSKIDDLKKFEPATYNTLFADYRCATEPITVRHHLTHTAQGVPGDGYRYNGFLFKLLSNVAEEVSGRPYRDLLVDTVTAPLDMQQTLPNRDSRRREFILANRAKYYRLDRSGNFVRSAYETDLSASAGIITTVRDLATFDVAIDKNLIVSRASKKKMFAAAISNNGRPLPYGMGWFVQTYRGVKLVWHYGLAPDAYSSLFLKVPERNLTLILLANSDGASAPFNLGAGNVMASPFAVAFLNRFADFEIDIPVTASIKNVHEPGNTAATYLDIVIGSGFSGKLPDDIDTITVSGPRGELPVSKDDFTYFSGIRTFWTRLPGSPASGTYRFKVSGAKSVGHASDIQSDVRTIPLPDNLSLSPVEGQILESFTPTFAWAAVKAGTSVYYRLEIRNTDGRRVYATGYAQDMLSHRIPEGVLAPDREYRWRIRVTDAENWIGVQNRSHSRWRYFKTGGLFGTISKIPEQSGLYPARRWQKIDNPQRLGWSPAKLAKARSYSLQIGSAAVMIVEDGLVVDAWGDIARNYQMHSMRKPLMSALIGIEVDEGRMDLSRTMVELGIDDYPPALSKIEKKATVADLIRSRSGIYHPALGEVAAMQRMRPNRHSHAPGTFYYYNNWDFNAIGTIFEKESGTTIFEAFNRRVAGPLQMEDFDTGNCWYESGDVSRHRYYGFRMSARDLARFGLLYLRNGRWQNRQIVSSAWVRQSTASHSVICAYRGYGYMWGTSQNGGPYTNISIKARTFGHSGLGVHFFRVIPARNLVIVHRVDTDKHGSYPHASQLGRLLWMILDAAGETDIGDNPSLAAASGIRLSAYNYKKILGKGIITAQGKTPAGLVERAEHYFIVSMFPDGSMSVKGGLEDTGKWWFEQDECCMHLDHLQRLRSIVLLDGNTLKFFTLDGTLDFLLTVISD